MNSNKDKAIKRYLAKVGTLDKSAKANNSKYYIVTYSELFKIKIRFSDHFSSEGKTSIDIIKTHSNIYVIKLIIGISFAVNENDILSYLKSILLLFPEMFSSYNTLRNSNSKASIQIQRRDCEIKKLQDLINKKESDYELIDSVYEENKKLKGEIKDLRNNYNTQKSINSKLKDKLNKIIELIKSK